MLEGDDDHRDVLRCCCRDLQRQGRFAHAGRTRQQVQPLIEAAQEAIELREASGHTQHGAAGGLPLQATRFRVRQDLGQQRTRPLQPACCRVTQRRLHAERFFLQQGDDVRRGRGLIEERLRQPLLRRRQQTTLVQVHETLGGRVGVRGRQPVCRYMRALSRLHSNNKWLPRILRADE